MDHVGGNQGPGADERACGHVGCCRRLSAGGQQCQQADRREDAVSRLLADLEKALGVQLIARTTRSCRPTAAGERFYERIRTVLADIDLATR